MSRRVPAENPNLGVGDTFTFSRATQGTRLAVEWISTSGMIADLDIVVLYYDERKLTSDNPVSFDESGQLEADIDMYEQSSSHQENVHFDLTKIDPHTAAIVLFVDGGPRNFQFVQTVIVHCSQENIDSDSSNFMSKVEPGAYSNALLFQSASRARKDFQGVALNVIFRDGWNDDGTPKWHIKNIFEPLYVPTSREKDERCAQIVITTVPSLDKYRPRLFPSVKAICSALSSTSLPKLKKCFQKGNGLPIKQFTEVLYQQLYETNPRVAEEDESGYTVALLQDMFSQIDFNGDGAVDWDEFTTFCIHTGLVGSGAGGASDGPSASTKDTLDDYVIEYGEDNELKDFTLNSYSPLAGMRYAPTTRRILVTPEKRECVMMFDDNFQHICTLDPHKLNDVEAHERLKVYDCIYISSRDVYVYCASDHTIVVCKEKSSLGGKKIHYATVHRIYSSYLHIKLCWSEASSILCTVAADNVIYGWDLEGTVPLFHISRHKELITDFIAIDSMELFVTCSLDKRIVLWSQSSRRVKGVLLGHKRGVRVLSFAKGILLSAGFECDARTWDVNLKEPTLILKGHRMPIAAARMMCAPDTPDDNLRAITVDDGGEFRLWNVFVKEKGSGCGFAQVLQVFTTNASEPQVGQIRFFELPFHPVSSKGNYSDIIAASSKLVHVIPEKNAAEFVPPTCVCYSEPNACVVTGIGRSLYKYDLSIGSFQAAVNDVDGTDVTYLALDGDYGRRIFVGCTSGNILLLNFATGQILDSVAAHSKEVSAIAIIKTVRTLIFSGSFDGKIRCIEETGGNLLMHNTADNAFGDGSGITAIKLVDSIKVVIAASAGRKWGIWNMLTLKRIIMIEEHDPVSSIEILGASGDDADIEMHMQEGTKMENTNYVSFAVCTLCGIRIYVVDTFNVTIAVTHELTHKVPMYISGMTLLRCPQQGSVNYTENHATSCARFGLLLVAIADEGFVLLWKADHLRQDSMASFVKMFPPPDDESRGPSTTHTRANSVRKLDVDDISSASIVESSIEYISESLASKLEKLVPFAPAETTMSSHNEEGEKIEKDAAGSVFSLTTTGSEVTCAHTSPTQKISSLESHKKYRDSRRAQAASRKHSITTSALGNHLVVGEDRKIAEYTIKNWRAHMDIIQDIVPLHEHGCFVTISLDGYNRIWNLDGDMLGELQLPNITEKMKNRRLSDEPTKWKFILEKIPVLKSHRDIAAKLVKALTQEATPRDEKERRKGGISSGLGPNGLSGLKPKPARPKRTITSDARDVLRMEILTKLNETESILPESTGSLKIPLPEISPIKQSKRGMQMTAASCGKLDSDDDLSSISGNSSVKFVRGSDGMSVSSSMTELSKSQRSFASISTMWIDSQSLHTSQSAPFSEASITLSHQEGLIDGEGHKILRKVNADKDKVDAYNRSVPTVSIRNVGLSTSISMPAKGTSAESEVSFGTQKGMYKHANKVYSERRKYSSAQARHVLSMSRIKANVRRMGDMIQINSPPTHDLISLPPIKGTGDEEDEEEIERIRQQMVYEALAKSRQGSRRMSNIGNTSNSGVKELNREKVVALMQRIHDAEKGGVPDWELKQFDPAKPRVRKKTLKRSYTAAEIETSVLEKKLGAAIRNSYRHTLDSGNGKKILTTRMLLPYYKMADVKHFLDIFQKVDEDYSGDLDPDEWCKFLTSLNKAVTLQQARAIFNRVDVNGEGCLSIQDLIPVVFGQATKEIQRAIVMYIEAEVSKRKIVGKDFLKESDLECLFEHYDENVVGFVPVSFLREKVKCMQLPEAANYEVLQTMKDMEDDEMVNKGEFVRIFRLYLL